MANPEHLAILNQGAEVWNQWRRDNPTTRSDLRRADLREADLREVDLRRSHLSTAELGGARLSRADLRKAHLRNANLSGAFHRDIDLNEENLDKDVHPSGWERFTMVYRNGANLNDADLSGADLSGAYLKRADLSGANLSDANLSGADFRAADLRKANLHGAELSETNLCGADLSGANLSGARMNRTNLGYIDLGQAKGLEGVHHMGPSSIGMDTIYLSGGNIPEEFLRGVGVPDQFITYMKSLVGKSIEYYSAFISHSSKDKEFADRLFADLQNNNVRTWYAPEDLKIGDKFRQRIDESIRLHDKLLLVLSEESVASEWVEFEVEAALEKGGDVLFPVRIDDVVMQSEKAWAKHIKRTLHIGDFSQWKDHDAYQVAFKGLLRDLKAADGNRDVRS